MARMTGPDCAVMCNLINTHSHTFTQDLWFVILGVTVCFGTRGEEDFLGNRWPTSGYSNHDGSNDRNARGLGEFYLTMLYVPAYTYERRPYSATLFLTILTLDSPLALTTRAQRKTYGWCSTPGPMTGGDFLAYKENMCGCSRDTMTPSSIGC